MIMKKDGTQQNSFANMQASEILLRPRLTEKSVLMMEKNVYVFEVSSRANKVMVKNAIKSVYDVNPVKVAIVNAKPKKKRSVRTGKIGVKSGHKKAYVYLKDGDSISIM